MRAPPQHQLSASALVSKLFGIVQRRYIARRSLTRSRVRWKWVYSTDEQRKSPPQGFLSLVKENNNILYRAANCYCARILSSGTDEFAKVVNCTLRSCQHYAVCPYVTRGLLARVAMAQNTIVSCSSRAGKVKNLRVHVDLYIRGKDCFPVSILTVARGFYTFYTVVGWRSVE